MHISNLGEHTPTAELPLKLDADQVMMIKHLFINLTLSLVERKVIAAALNVDVDEVNKLYYGYCYQRKQFERKHSGECECLQLKFAPM